jgi:hypothetical protein
MTAEGTVGAPTCFSTMHHRRGIASGATPLAGLISKSIRTKDILNI